MAKERWQITHGTSVAAFGQGALIIGPSGSGKSSLAVSLLSLGAEVIADDQTELCVENQSIWMRKPASLPELIEIRGLGLLPIRSADQHPLKLVVDLAEVETARLPHRKCITLLGQKVTKLCKVETPCFPAGILHYLKTLSW